MSDQAGNPASGGPGGGQAPGLDTRHAHPARVYNYWLGGKDNYPADREAAEAAIAANPRIVTDVRANRAFLTRVVRYLAADCGIRQFLDIGTGPLPGPPGAGFPACSDIGVMLACPDRAQAATSPGSTSGPQASRTHGGRYMSGHSHTSSGPLTSRQMSSSVPFTSTIS